MTTSKNDMSTIINSAQAILRNSGVENYQSIVETSKLGWITQIQNHPAVWSAKSSRDLIKAADNFNIDLKSMPDLSVVSSARALHDAVSKLNPKLLGFQRFPDGFLDRRTISKTIEIAEKLRVGEMRQLLKTSNVKALNDALYPNQFSWVEQIRKQLEASDFQAIHQALKAVQTDDAISVRQNQQGYKDIAQDGESISEFEAALLDQIDLNPETIEAVQALGKADSKGRDPQYSEAMNDLVYGLTEIANYNSSFTFLEFFYKLAPKGKQLVLGMLGFVFADILGHLLWDVTVELVRDSVKPMIQNYVCESPIASIKFVNNLVCTTYAGNIGHIRVVKASSLRVRKTPNAKAEIIDVLPQFEPVTLIRKSESLSWSLVRYKNEDGEVMEGWVFSRYLHKLKI